jgi:hypothetical protein
MVLPVPVTVIGGLSTGMASIAILPPIDKVTRAPIPAATACFTALGS